MSRYTIKRLLVAALNSGDYGNNAIQSGTPVSMLTSGLEITPVTGDDIERPLDNGQRGGKQTLAVGTHVTMTAPFEITGSGTATTAPAYGMFFESAGYAPTVGADNVKYNRVTDNSEKDITTTGYMDGTMHYVPGVRSTFTTTMNVGEVPTFAFETTGLLGTIAAGAVPNATFTEFKDPVKVGATQTTMLLGGVEKAMLEFNCAENNEVVWDENTIAEAVYITDWAAEGTILIEAEDLGTFDPFDIYQKGTLLPLKITHGTQTGYIYEFEATQIQLGQPAYADRNGRMCYSLPYKVIGSHTHTFK